METKKMTIEQAQELVKNTKYIVWSEDESRQLQEKLFEIGCEWANFGQRVSHTEHPFLYVDQNMKLTYSHRCIYMCFEESKKRYLPWEDVVNIEIEQEPKEAPKHKFDPNTLKPYDRVLVRDGEKYQWKCTFFSHIKERATYMYKCTSYGSWNYCIPYNDETKHLVGTSDEAPEFYNLD